MGKELEVAILNVDEKEVRRRLTELNAMHTGQYNFSRVELMLEGEIGSGKSWIRVRTDGKETTMTFKRMEGEGDFAPMEEYEVKTDNFVNTVKILNSISNKLSYFENERDAYTLDSTYITIDKWPEIPTFVEIEAPTVKKLKEINERLGIRGDFVGNVSIDSIYRSYGKDFKAIVEKNRSRLMRLLEEDK